MMKNKFKTDVEENWVNAHRLVSRARKQFPNDLDAVKKYITGLGELQKNLADMENYVFKSFYYIPSKKTPIPTNPEQLRVVLGIYTVEELEEAAFLMENELKLSSNWLKQIERARMYSNQFGSPTQEFIVYIRYEVGFDVYGSVLTGYRANVTTLDDAWGRQDLYHLTMDSTDYIPFMNWLSNPF
tara:strand:- start:121 stop:675 length:555 start_codon:yes stop_codon:yes gene_type:complete